MLTLQTRQTEAAFDLWADWLLRQRSGVDQKHAVALNAKLARYADRVLDAAALRPGMTVLDLGTGDGLLAFRALDQMQGDLKVVMADRSAAIIRLATALAQREGYAEQCRVVLTDAEDLAGVEDASIDVVATRSVLAYVPDKAAAFRAIHRVVKPGGRFTIGEPVMREDALHAVALRSVTSQRPEWHTDRLLPLLHRWKAAQYPDTLEGLETTPYTNFSQTDLLRQAQEAGFTDLNLDIQVYADDRCAMAWETFINLSPHAMAPTLATIMQDKFTPEERAILETALRPTVESGAYGLTERMTYLSGTKALYN